MAMAMTHMRNSAPVVGKRYARGALKGGVATDA